MNFHVSYLFTYQKECQIQSYRRRYWMCPSREATISTDTRRCYPKKGCRTFPCEKTCTSTQAAKRKLEGRSGRARSCAPDLRIQPLVAPPPPPPPPTPPSAPSQSYCRQTGEKEKEKEEGREGEREKTRKRCAFTLRGFDPFFY